MKPARPSWLSLIENEGEEVATVTSNSNKATILVKSRTIFPFKQRARDQVLLVNVKR